MQYFYTLEAKSLIDDTYPAFDPKMRRGTLRKFLHDGSSTIFALDPSQRSAASSLYTSGINAARNKLIKQMEPWIELDSNGIFDGFEPAPAHPEGMIYWNSLLVAVDLVALFDMLVATTYRYPGHAGLDPAKVRLEALVTTMRPLYRVLKATRIVASGRAFDKG